MAKQLAVRGLTLRCTVSKSFDLLPSQAVVIDYLSEPVAPLSSGVQDLRGVLIALTRLSRLIFFESLWAKSLLQIL